MTHQSQETVNVSIFLHLLLCFSKFFAPVLTTSLQFRTKLAIGLTNVLNPLYVRLARYKRKPWQTSSTDLVTTYSTGTLGAAIGYFLRINEFELIPRFEDHDVLHVLLEYDTSLKGEIQLQYFLFGNGKRSVYVILTCSLGLLIAPEYCQAYSFAYARGRNARKIYSIDFREHLFTNINSLRDAFHIL